MTTDDLLTDLRAFLNRYCRDDIGTLALRYPLDQQSLYVDWEDISRYDRELSDLVLEKPDQMRDYLQEALYTVSLPYDIDLSGAHVRIYNLPELYTFEVNEVVETERIGKLLDTEAVVQKVSAVKPRLKNGAFQCLRCGTVAHIEQNRDSYQEPSECRGCERKGPFDLVKSQSEWVDYQLVRLQDPPEIGTGPDVDVHLTDDLTKEVKAGDRVTLTGVLDVEAPRNKDSPVFNGKLVGRAITREESDYSDIDVAEHIDEIQALANGDYGDIFELLVDSVNPGHYGDETIKLALALQLFGGFEHVSPDNSRERGDWHTFLIGDPGGGKSTFLRWMAEVAPRSIQASGEGSSAAGLTAAAVSDGFGDGKFSLEAGALVLANGGLACVDELDKMKEDAVSSMHDALEGQMVHINKAGIEADLPAKTSVVAAGNPRYGRFDTFQAIAEQIDLPPALITRFDLIFVMKDLPDAEKDRKVSRHKLENRQISGRYTRDGEISEEEQELVDPAIAPEVLRAYVAHAKQTCFPVLNDEAAEYIINHFVKFRTLGADEQNPVPLTYRKIEAIERIAESAARVRLSDTAGLDDAKIAVKLVTESLKQVGIDPETGEFDADVIETGKPKTQQDRQKFVIDLIDELDNPDEDEILQVADNEGYDPEKIAAELERLSEQGLIYTLTSGIIGTL